MKTRLIFFKVYIKLVNGGLKSGLCPYPVLHQVCNLRQTPMWESAEPRHNLLIFQQ